MNNATFIERVKQRLSEDMPLPFTERTTERLLQMYETGREDLSLAKICEAHWDAQGILSEAGHTIHSGSIYGVWASEIPGNKLTLVKQGKNYFLSGKKMFCSGAGIVDRALITAFSKHSVLIDLDLKNNAKHIQSSKDAWFTTAFQQTSTASITFDNVPVEPASIIEEPNWYVTRQGFWPGALGPAACWAGGAAGLVEYAKNNKRSDAHTLAHLGAMTANVWTMLAILHSAGKFIDEDNLHQINLHELALTVRHQIEQLSSDIIRRFARAYGPFPLACDEKIARRYQELDLFLRQNHAERDLESLGVLIFNRT